MNEGRELHRTLRPRNKTSLQNKGLAEALPSLPGVDPIPQESTQGSWLFRSRSPCVIPTLLLRERCREGVEPLRGCPQRILSPLFQRIRSPRIIYLQQLTKDDRAVS